MLTYKKQKKYTAKDIHRIIGFDHVFDYKDGFKVYSGYYYQMEVSAEKLMKQVSSRLSNAGINHTILDCGDLWSEFCGADPTRKSSHFWVTFKITD